MGVSVNNINFADLSLRHVQDIGHEQSQAGEMGQGNNIVTKMSRYSLDKTVIQFAPWAEVRQTEY